MDKHAVFMNTRTATGREVTFRVGQPVDWDTAIARWDRLDTRRRKGRNQAVRHDRRRYVARSFEVRSVDENGRGQGSPRHHEAFPVPYRACRVAR